MQEFEIVSAPASDPAALARTLTDRSAAGWDVVTIVATGSDLTAFLSREAAPAQPVVAEPAGWAPTPQPIPASQPTLQVAQPTVQPAVQPVAQPVAQAAPAAASGVPANWYADPSGRFELRYWDGNQWTEHVSRGGQQFTDPPVA